MKTLPTLLTLCCSLLFAGACTDTANDDRGASLALLSNGEDLPEECNICWEDFQECFANGGSADECSERIVECVESCQAPPPPPECLHCAAGFDACAQSAEQDDGSAQDCAVGFEGCLSSCQSDVACDEANGEDCQPCDEANGEPGCPVEPPPVDDCHQCEEQYHECVDQAWQGGEDPQQENNDCERGWDECLQSCDQDPPPPHDDSCELYQNYCENGQNPGDPANPEEWDCDELRQRCEDQTNPQPEPNDCNECEQAREDCQDGEGGNSPENCQEVEEFCAQVCP